MNRNTIFPLFFLCTLFSSAFADDRPLNWSIKGFGTLGLAGTDTRQIGFKRDLSQDQDVTKSLGITTDSRLGIQLDLDINNFLHVTTQWVAKDHSGDFIEQNFEWGFLRWSPNNELDIRLGRMGADTFLLSDYRNVGYAYPWMRPPHEFYANLPFFHYDGVDITKKFFFDDSQLAIKFFAGYSFNQLPTLFNDLFEVETPIVGGNIVYNSGNWRSRLGYGYLRVLSEAPIQELSNIINQPSLNFAIPNINRLASKISIKNTDIQFFSIGSAYDDGTWFSHAEASYIETQNSFFPDSANAYFSIGRRFSTVSLYSLYGISQTFHNNVSIPKPIFNSPELSQITDTLDQAINGNGTDEQSISLGLRWDFHPNIAAKAQWSHFWLGRNGVALWQRPISDKTPDTVNVWSFGFDFIF